MSSRVRSSIEARWGGGGERWYPNLSALVHDLRKKTEEDPRNPSRIVTHYGVGYRYRRVEKETRRERNEGMVSPLHQTS